LTPNASDAVRPADLAHTLEVFRVVYQVINSEHAGMYASMYARIGLFIKEARGFNFSSQNQLLSHPLFLFWRLLNKFGDNDWRAYLTEYFPQSYGGANRLRSPRSCAQLLMLWN
jgi:hypothetical protein